MWIDEKFSKINEYLKKNNNLYESIIDLGSRDQILRKFLPTNIEYTGVDKFYKKNNLNIDVEQDIPLIKNKYDIVIALDIIEHLNDPINFFNNCKSISNKLIIINIPNAAYYKFRLNLLSKGEITEKFHFSGNYEEDRHRWFTTYNNTKKFLKNINYEEYEIISTKVYKTRNKLKFLFYIEKFLGNFFPNVFCWSILIFFKKKF